MKRILFGIGRALGTAGRATVALIGLGVIAAVATNYTMTQGSGTTFGSIVVSAVNYPQQLICDLTTPTQCGAVTATGGQIVDVATSSNQLHTDITAPPTLGSATGGLSVKTLAALSTTPISVKASAGQVYSVQCQNNDATHVAYIQLFNTTPVSLGSTAPTKFVGVPPTLNSGYAFSLVGEQFSSVIIAAAASTATGGSAPTTAIDCTIDFN